MPRTLITARDVVYPYIEGIDLTQQARAEAQAGLTLTLHQGLGSGTTFWSAQTLGTQAQLRVLSPSRARTSLVVEY